MELRNTPAVFPAIGLLLGARLGLSECSLPFGLLFASILLGLAIGRPTGRFLAVFALGAVLGGVGRGEEADRWLPVRDRPVHVSAKVTAPPVRVDSGWALHATTESIRQGRSIRTRPLDVTVILPDDVSQGSEQASELPRMGALIRLRGFLRRSSGYANVPTIDPGPWRMTVKSRRLLKLQQGAPRALDLVHSVRHRVEAALEDATSTAEARGSFAPVLRALVLGDSGRLEATQRRWLRANGLAHLFAVSGLHVGMVLALALIAGRFLRWRRVWPALSSPVVIAGRFLPLLRSFRWSIAWLAVAFYFALVGPRPSIIRSAIMVSLVVLAAVSERPHRSVNALAVAAGLMTVLEPSMVLDVGFLLSVSATAGIVLLAPGLVTIWTGRKREKDPAVANTVGVRPRWASFRLPAWLARPLAASIGAQLAVAPVAVTTFHRVAPLAFLVNLIAVPWAALCLACGLGWSLVAVVSPEVATFLLPLLDPLARPLEWAAGLPAKPWASVNLTGSSPAVALGCLAIYGACRRPLRFGLPIVLGFSLLMFGRSAERKSLVDLWMIDVGQGDSILLRDGDQTLLVDGGGWPFGDLGGKVLAPALAGLGVRSLDAVAVTHGDRDHCGGLIELASYLEIDQVWTAGAADSEGCVGRLVERVGRPAVRHRVWQVGTTRRLGRWTLRAVWPDLPADSQDSHARGGSRSLGDNDRSLVFIAEVFGRSVLLTGDLEARGERNLLRREEHELSSSIDVLKVGHHGSRTSSTDAFLERLQPRWALISAGRHNPYGHPAPEVIQRLRERGIRILRTDQHGIIGLRFVPKDEGRGKIHLQLPADLDSVRPVYPRETDP